MQVDIINRDSVLVHQLNETQFQAFKLKVDAGRTTTPDGRRRRTDDDDDGRIDIRNPPLSSGWRN